MQHQISAGLPPYFVKLLQMTLVLENKTPLNLTYLVIFVIHKLICVHFNQLPDRYRILLWGNIAACIQPLITQVAFFMPIIAIGSGQISVPSTPDHAV